MDSHLKVTLETETHKYSEYESLTSDAWTTWPKAENLERILMAKSLAGSLQVIETPFAKKYKNQASGQAKPKVRDSKSKRYGRRGQGRTLGRTRPSTSAG